MISEVSSCYYLNADCWFEVHNTSSVSLQMNQFQLRSYAVDVVTKSVSLATFDLPAVLLAPDAYAIVSGNASNRAQISTQNMKVRQGNLIPIWQDSGLIELVKDGATVDFVSFGDLALLPLSAQAWNGANVPALPSSPTDHGRAIVRPYTSYGATNTRSAADWVSVDWVTPAGRNDVGPGVLDEDQDGIPDSAEVQGGTYAGLDLYAMGARAGTKNLFLEVDQMWSNDAGVVVQKAALQKVVDAFASHDIVVSFDAGSAFSSSFSTADFNLGQTDYRVPLERCTTTDQSTCVRNSSTRRSIYDWKDEFMDLRRRAIFHYALFAVSQNVDGSCGSSGVGELLGNDFLVTLGGCGLSLSDSDRRNATINFQAATVMHELGHNLGLRHGGDDVAQHHVTDVLGLHASALERGLDDQGAQFGRRDVLQRATIRADGSAGGAHEDDFTSHVDFLMRWGRDGSDNDTFDSASCQFNKIRMPIITPKVLHRNNLADL